MKVTEYFKTTRDRPDRASIMDEWILQVVNNPEHEVIQTDNRIRRWGRIKDANNRYLRVVLLDDKETIHNAFFDRRFKGNNS